MDDLPTMIDQPVSDLYGFFATGHRVRLRVPEGMTAEEFRDEIRQGKHAGSWLELADGGHVQLANVAVVRCYKRIGWEELEGVAEEDEPQAEATLTGELTVEQIIGR